MMKLQYRIQLLLLLTIVSCSTAKKTSIAPTPPAPVEPKPEPVAVVKDTVKEIKPVFTERSITLLLPLNAREQLAADTIPDQPLQLSQSTLPAIHFLEGALIAVDSLLPLKVKCDLKIIDTGLDSVETVKKIKTLSAVKSEAVISLLPSAFNAQLGVASDSLNKPVFILQAGNTSLLQKHPYLQLATASNTTQIRSAAAYMARKWPASRFILVYRDQRGEDALASLYAGELDSTLGVSGKSVKLNYKSAGWNGLKEKLDKSKRNVLIIPTTDESFLSSILIKLAEVKNDYSIMLAGLPVWESFETIDPSVLTGFNTHIFNNLFLDFNYPATTAFRNAFVSRYHGDPLPQAYIAYDLIRMIALGTGMGDNYAAPSFPVVAFPVGGYRFSKACTECGSENSNVSVLRYGDYVMQRVNP